MEKVYVMTCGTDKPRVFSNLDIAYDSLCKKKDLFESASFPSKQLLRNLEKEAENFSEDFLFFNRNRPKGCFTTVQLTSVNVDE